MTDWEHLSVHSDWQDRRDRMLIVPGELLSVYQPSIGAQATLAWLNLSYLIQEVGVIPDPVAELQSRQGLTRAEAETALRRLRDARLLEAAPEGGLVLREPSSRGRLAARSLRLGEAGAVVEDPLADLAEAESRQSPLPHVAEALRDPERESTSDGEVASAVFQEESASQAAGAPSPLQAVVDFYQKRIGMLGPVQYDKLRFWVEEKQVSPDVVAVAIEETAATAENPRIQYLEGILRNWYNDGIRTMKDLINSNSLPTALRGRREENLTETASSPAATRRRSGRSGRREAERAGRGGTAADGSREGLPNAAAYRKVDPEQIRRWKALYPEEYAGS